MQSQDVDLIENKNINIPLTNLSEDESNTDTDIFTPEIIKELLESQMSSANNLKEIISLKKKLCQMLEVALTSKSSIFTSGIDKLSICASFNTNLLSLFKDVLIDKMNDKSFMLLLEGGKFFNNGQNEESAMEIPIPDSVTFDAKRMTDLLFEIGLISKAKEAYDDALMQINNTSNDNYDVNEDKNKIAGHLLAIEEIPNELERLNAYLEILNILSDSNLAKKEGGMKTGVFGAIAATAAALSSACNMIMIPKSNEWGFLDSKGKYVIFNDDYERRFVSTIPPEALCIKDETNKNIVLDFLKEPEGKEFKLAGDIDEEEGWASEEEEEEEEEGKVVKDDGEGEREIGNQLVDTSIAVDKVEPVTYTSRLMNHEELTSALIATYQNQFGQNANVSINYSYLLDSVIETIIVNAIKNINNEDGTENEQKSIIKDLYERKIITLGSIEKYAKEYLLKKKDNSLNEPDLIFKTSLSIDEEENYKSSINQYLDNYYEIYTNSMLEKLNESLKEMETDFNSLGKSIDTFGRHILDLDISHTFDTSDVIKQQTTFDWITGKSPELIKTKQKSAAQEAVNLLTELKVESKPYEMLEGQIPGLIEGSSSKQDLLEGQPEVFGESSGLMVSEERPGQMQQFINPSDIKSVKGEIEQGVSNVVITDKEGNKLDEAQIKSEIATKRIEISDKLLAFSRPFLEISPATLGSDGQIIVVFKFKNLKNNEILKSLSGLISKSVEKKIKETKNQIIGSLFGESEEGEYEADFRIEESNNFPKIIDNPLASSHVIKYKQFKEFLSRNTFLIKASARITSVLDVGLDCFSYLSPVEQAAIMQERIAELKSYAVALRTTDALNAYLNENKENLESAQLKNQEIAANQYAKNLREVTKLEVLKLNEKAKSLTVKTDASQEVLNAEWEAFMQPLFGNFEAIIKANSLSTEGAIATSLFLFFFLKGAFKIMPSFMYEMLKGLGYILFAGVAGAYAYKILKDTGIGKIINNIDTTNIITGVTKIYETLSGGLSSVTTTISTIDPTKFYNDFYGWVIANPIVGAGYVFGTVTVLGIGGYCYVIYYVNKGKKTIITIPVDTNSIKAEKKNGDNTKWVVIQDDGSKIYAPISQNTNPIKVKSSEDKDAWLIPQSGWIFSVSNDSTNYKSVKATTYNINGQIDNNVWESPGYDSDSSFEFEYNGNEGVVSDWIIMNIQGNKFAYWCDKKSGLAFPITHWENGTMRPTNGGKAIANKQLGGQPVSEVDLSTQVRSTPFYQKVQLSMEAEVGGHLKQRKPKPKTKTVKNKKNNKTRKPKRSLNKNKQNKKNKNKNSKNKHKNPKTKKHKKTIRNK